MRHLQREYGWRHLAWLENLLRWADAPDNTRFFGTLQRQAEIAPGVRLAVGGGNCVAK